MIAHLAIKTATRQALESRLTGYTTGLQNLCARAGAMVLALALASCAGTPTDNDTSAVVDRPPAVTDIPDPTPPEPEQQIDRDALFKIRDIALTDGILEARAYRNALLVRGLDATSAALIDSELAWLSGDTALAEQQLSAASITDLDGQLLVLSVRHERAQLRGQWLTAAKLAHQRLLQSPEQTLALKDPVWENLMHLSDTQLASALLQTDSADWRGWLLLNQAYRQGRMKVNGWLATHMQHSAVQPLPAGLNAWLDAQPPSKIAVLLPLSGRLQGAGEAVLQGVLESLYIEYRDVDSRPALITVDTDRFPDAIAAYREAIRDGADRVIGPLTKADVQLLGSLRERPVPVLALNRPEALPPGEAINWAALSLAPEDEARQIAQMAFGRGLRRAMIVRPDTDWGSRMESALSQTWRKLGGVTVRTLPLRNDPPVSQQVSELVGGAASEQRITDIEAAFEAPVEARARRRQDFDVVFLLAPTPADARKLRPLLVFHYSGDVPVYSPAAIYSGHRHLQNRDLNDIVFVETPAVLEAVDVDRYSRLTALGTDAVRTLDHWEQSQVSRAPFLRADTGLLNRLINGEIERELVPVEFAGDRVRPHQLP